MENEWLIWQLADSAFPSGGFAHSGGLEAACQHGIIRDGASLEGFLTASLIQIRCGIARFMHMAWQEPEDFCRIDAECDLFLNNHIANRASRAQGRAFLTSCSQIFATDQFIALASSIRQQNQPSHMAPVFGVVTQAMKLSKERASSLFLFISLRAWLSSAVRLGIVGPIEAQQIQAGFSEIRTGPEDPACEAVQTAPLFDLLAATQDRLYSRLFQS